jgi:hypothetical protein
VLAGAGEVIEQGGLAGVGIAGEGNGDGGVHGSVFLAGLVGGRTGCIAAGGRGEGLVGGGWAGTGGECSPGNRVAVAQEKARPVPSGAAYLCFDGGLSVGSVFSGEEQSDRDPQPAQPPPQEGAFRFRQMVRRRRPRNTRAAMTVRMTMRFCTAGVSVQRGSTRILAAVRASRLMVPPLTLIMH